MTTRVEFVKSVQELISKTNCDDVQIRYGYRDSSGEFFDSDVDVNTDGYKYETVLVKYNAQSDMFGIKQSIEGDSLYSILKDILKAIDRL